MGGLRSCYAFRGSGPHLSAQEGSEVAMRPMALDPASQLGASRNTRVLRATRIKNSLGYAATLTPYQAVHTSYQDVIRQGRHHGPAKRAAGGTLNTSETCGQAATEPLWCSATPLTTPDVPLQCGWPDSSVQQSRYSARWSDSTGPCYAWVWHGMTAWVRHGMTTRWHGLHVSKDIISYFS
jgi:hypothetical protein